MEELQLPIMVLHPDHPSGVYAHSYAACVDMDEGILYLLVLHIFSRVHGACGV